LYGKALKKHYLKSSIYLMTSRYEGFGLVLLEAMNFGLPIIAFSQSGSKEILNNGKYGILVSNGDVEAMYEKLLDFINDVNLREEYQQKSIKRVKDFSLDAITKQWEKTINNL
jgi:Glycosyltransferase